MSEVFMNKETIMLHVDGRAQWLINTTLFKDCQHMFDLSLPMLRLAYGLAVGPVALVLAGLLAPPFLAGLIVWTLLCATVQTSRNYNLVNLEHSGRR